MQKADYLELWYERMRLELMTGYGMRPLLSDRDKAARNRISEILKRIPQEIQDQFVEEMKEAGKEHMQAVEAARKRVAEREAAKRRDDGK